MLRSRAGKSRVGEFLSRPNRNYGSGGCSSTKLLSGFGKVTNATTGTFGAPHGNWAFTIPWNSLTMKLPFDFRCAESVVNILGSMDRWTALSTSGNALDEPARREKKRRRPKYSASSNANAPGHTGDGLKEQWELNAARVCRGSKWRIKMGPYMNSRTKPASRTRSGTIYITDGSTSLRRPRFASNRCAESSSNSPSCA